MICKLTRKLYSRKLQSLILDGVNKLLLLLYAKIQLRRKNEAISVLQFPVKTYERQRAFIFFHKIQPFYTFRANIFGKLYPYLFCNHWKLLFEINNCDIKIIKIDQAIQLHINSHVGYAQIQFSRKSSMQETLQPTDKTEKDFSLFILCH